MQKNGAACTRLTWKGYTELSAQYASINTTESGDFLIVLGGDQPGIAAIISQMKMKVFFFPLYCAPEQVPDGF